MDDTLIKYDWSLYINTWNISNFGESLIKWVKVTYSGVSRVVQRSKALHRSDSCVTTDPGSIPGCVAAGRDRETHEAAQNWLRGGFGQLGCPCPIAL